MSDQPRPTSGSTNGDTDAEHAEIRELLRRQHERPGRLLAIAEVWVYESEAQPQVRFPSEAALSPDSDPDEIAVVVRRAREELGRWR